MSSGSTDNTADSRALPLSSANCGGATETMLGACVIRCRIAPMVWLCSGEAAPPSGKVTSTRMGPSAPGPRAWAAAPTPARISCDESNWRSRLLPSTIEAAGAAITSRTSDAARAEIHGRRITQPIQRFQNRDWPPSGPRDQCRNADRLAAERPNVASAAGVSVVEVSIATATARIAPVAIDFSAGVLIT
jgi:hypothetical protein